MWGRALAFRVFVARSSGAVVVVGLGSGSTSGARGGESSTSGSVTDEADSMTAGELVAALVDSGDVL